MGLRSLKGRVYAVLTEFDADNRHDLYLGVHLNKGLPENGQDVGRPSGND